MSVLLLLAALAGTGTAHAGESDAAVDRKGAYAGIFMGSGRTGSRIVDIDGFANWGNPGWSVKYDESGLVGGVLLGRRMERGNLPIRIEFDAMIGGKTAVTNRLDPRIMDETVRSEFRWVATARAGLERPLGRATVFATAGLALARIRNSVTDIDYSPDGPPWVDFDDSFRNDSTETGWVLGLGIEAPLAEASLIRLEGLYMDFGRSMHVVNHSGDGRCGPEGVRRPCPYAIGNELGIVRLAFIRQFGP
ncbi:MAG: hypothetical protein F4244_10545 [Gammaproteobacteria bacterium]|nr:hypothetical protein [Gammaproteobacteria bacterium]